MKELALCGGGGERFNKGRLPAEFAGSNSGAGHTGDKTRHTELWKHLARQPRLQEESAAAQEAKHTDDRLPRTRHAPKALCSRVTGSMRVAASLLDSCQCTGRTQRLRCRRIIASGARTWPLLAALRRAGGLARSRGSSLLPLVLSRQHRASSSAGALPKCR